MDLRLVTLHVVRRIDPASSHLQVGFCRVSDCQSSSGIAVVYIAYQPYGIGAFQRFLDSYRQHPAGIAHDLVIAYKGFASATDAADYEMLLGALANRALTVPDNGYDIGTYGFVARATRYRRYCFLNTQSQLVSDNWLRLLDLAASRPGVGLAGATASNQSLLSGHFDHCAIRGRPRTLREFVRGSFLNTLRHRWHYPRFPNPHLRTNAFVVDRALWLSLTQRQICNKRDASRFENGHKSITRIVERKGLAAVVVGRDGEVFERQRWPNSGTFWQEKQGNLLVADNQTRKYDEADPEERETLTLAAWGRGTVRFPLSEVSAAKFFA